MVQTETKLTRPDTTQVALTTRKMYKFDSTNHVHLLDDVPLHGVTSVLGIIAKPALIPWAVGVAVDYIDKKLQVMDMGGINIVGFSPEYWETVAKEAKSAHRKKKEKAGDWGSAVHLAVEEWIKDKKLPDLKDTQLQAFEHFKKWAEDNKVEFLESEKHVYSKDLVIGGIVDLVFMMDGKKYIGDIKTSSGIYNEAFFQMGAYNLCLESMGEHKDVEGYIVINLKKDGTMDLKMAVDMELNKNAFKHALGLYQIIQSLK